LRLGLIAAILLRCIVLLCVVCHHPSCALSSSRFRFLNTDNR
jgi:hypothetical protein